MAWLNAAHRNTANQYQHMTIPTKWTDSDQTGLQPQYVWLESMFFCQRESLLDKKKKNVKL